MTLFGQFDCGMPRDPKMIAAGPLARLVYFEASLYCRENLTDGVINRLWLPFFAVDVPQRKKIQLLNKLVDTGALEHHTDGWCIPIEVWRRWNPLKADVEKHREAEKARKAAYRERKRNGHSPEDVPTGQPVPATDRANSHSQSQSNSQSHSQDTSRRLTTPKESAPELRDDDERFALVVAAIVKTREQAAGNIRNKRPWRAAVKASILREDGDRIQQLLRTYPDAPTSVIAAAIEGDTHSLAQWRPT